MSKRQQLEVLNRTQCLDLLQRVRVGRLVFTEDALPGRRLPQHRRGVRG